MRKSESGEHFCGKAGKILAGTQWASLCHVTSTADPQLHVFLTARRPTAVSNSLFLQSFTHFHARLINRPLFANLLSVIFACQSNDLLRATSLLQLSDV